MVDGEVVDSEVTFDLVEVEGDAPFGTVSLGGSKLVEVVSDAPFGNISLGDSKLVEVESDAPFGKISFGESKLVAPFEFISFEFSLTAIGNVTFEEFKSVALLGSTVDRDSDSEAPFGIVGLEGSGSMGTVDDV